MSNLIVGEPDDEDIKHYDRSLLKEAERVIEDIRFGVDMAELSTQLDQTNNMARLNLRTLEKKEYCIELTAEGYRIVAYQFDTIDPKLDQIDDQNAVIFETYESLMHAISPLFVLKFNDSVAERLNSIK